MRIQLLVSPLAKGAYFDAYLDVAGAELAVHWSGDVELTQIGGLDLLALEVEEGASLADLARLSFVQGIFRTEGAGLIPLEPGSDLVLPEAVVYGAKYQGKTNERVTQMALNLALHFCATGRAGKTLLDPMAGRGTTLLWALRYGIDSSGIELDAAARGALHNHLKKQTKLHRIKHSHCDGRVGKKSRSGVGEYSLYEMAGHSLRLITGDSRHAPELVGGQKFDLIVADLPYGVRFRGSSKQSLTELVQECAPVWLARLRAGGAMVLVFNSYQPSRAELEAAFSGEGVRVEDFSAAHRMSESIVRDFFVVTRAPSSW